MSKQPLKQMSISDQSKKLTNVVTELTDKDLEKFVGGSYISYNALGPDKAPKASGSGSGSGTYRRACTAVSRCGRG